MEPLASMERSFWGKYDGFPISLDGHRPGEAHDRLLDIRSGMRPGGDAVRASSEHRLRRFHVGRVRRRLERLQQP